jgi:hypothetical protein
MNNTLKKLFILPAILFLVIIFSCNKSEISVSKTVALKSGTEKFRNATDKNLNVLLFDEGHAADKDSTDPKHNHLHLFNMNYLTDGSQALLESNLAFGFTELQQNEVILSGAPSFAWEEQVPWGYCINDGSVMTGFFLDYYVSDKLANNKSALKDFKSWFEEVVVDWMNVNNLAPKVKSDKPGDYWKKIIGSVE